MDRDSVLELLQDRAWTDSDRAAALRETHISWIVLRGDFAYKIKKPVNFGFLDFSTLERRRHYCERELELNKRFAPELYLGVVPVCEVGGRPRIGGDGPVVDYAVKMRRFDEQLLLDNMAARGELDRQLVRAIAREIATQQGNAPVHHPNPDSMDPGAPGILRDAMVENFRQSREYNLLPREQRLLAEVEQWSLRQFGQLQPLLVQRVAAGMVLDGHGDAHLGNIALVDGRVRLFDCIEFNDELRVMDSIADIAFLAMDLEARGHPGESHNLLSDYLEYRDDFPGMAALDLYRCYFAMVRAKVALLRAPAGNSAGGDTPGYPDFSRYLDLAASYCRPRTGFLAITRGVSGSGKSTIADGLVKAGGAVRIRSDVERKRLFGLAPEQRSRPGDEPVLYGAAMSRRAFDRLRRLAAGLIHAGFPVIVDATFLHRQSRDRFRLLAQRLQIPFAIIDCEASPGELRRRLLQREQRGADASEAGIRVMEQQLESGEPLSDVELGYRLEPDPLERPEGLWNRLREQLRAG